MPARIVPYLRGLIQGHKITATLLRDQFGFSHDALTRTLQTRFPWRQIFLLAIQTLFSPLSGGYLIIDDTVIPKPYSKKMTGASYVYSSLLETTVFGYNIVFLAWTNGTITLPISWRWYKKDGPSKIKLAQSLIWEARVVWKLSPDLVLFDSFYAADPLLDKINSYGWKFVCQIKGSRIVNAAPIREDLTEDGDSLTGLVSFKVKGKIVRHDKKFFCTDRLTLSSEEILSLYGHRWEIEEVFRFAKDQLHLEECQARSKISQETHLAGTMLAYTMIQKQKQDTPSQTLYAIKKDWLLNRKLGNNRINHYAKILGA